MAVFIGRRENEGGEREGTGGRAQHINIIIRLCVSHFSFFFCQLFSIEDFSPF